MRSGVALLLVCLILTVAGPASGTYGDEQATALIAITADLEWALEAARRGRSAHPAFLADLEGILARLQEVSRAHSPWTWGTYDPVTPPAERDLVAHFTFAPPTQRGPTCIDTVGTSSVGLLEEGPRWLAEGPGGGALSLPEDEHPGAALFLDLAGHSALTIQFWVYLRDWGPDGPRGYGRMLHTAEDAILIFAHGSGYAGYHNRSLVVQIATETGLYRLSSESDSLSLGRWHHVAVVVDRDVTVYIDGHQQELRQETGAPGRFQAPQSWLHWLGNRSEGDRRLYGELADLRLYGTVRRAADIRRDMDATRPR